MVAIRDVPDVRVSATGDDASTDTRGTTVNEDSHITTTDGNAVGFADQGTGPAVLLIHAGVFADWFVPVAAQRALAGHRVVRIRRAGYVAGHVPSGPVSLAAHGAHAAAVLDHLGLADVTVVGHSSGSLVALELACARPDLVRSLLLVEPAPGGALASPELGSAMAALFDGDPNEPFPDAVFDRFMGTVCAADYREVLEQALGDTSLATALQESRFFFADEVAAVGSSPFGPDDAARIACPAVVLVGAASPPPVHDVAERLADWLPTATVEIFPEADHLLPLRQPAALAKRVAALATAAGLR